MARNRKAFVLHGHTDDAGDDIWYTAFDAAQIGQVGVNGEVEFTMKTKDSGGRTYYNIVKNVIVHNPGDDTSVSGTSTRSNGSAGRPSTAKPGAVVIDRERCIVRQNSINVAAQIMQSMIFSETDPLDMADMCLTIAKRLEDHTSGDADLREALAGNEKTAESDSPSQQANRILPYGDVQMTQGILRQDTGD